MKVKNISYLIDKFKGKYRIKAPINSVTNDFDRKLNGTYEDVDLYIDCMNDIKVFYYGSGILEVYIPSLQKGHNIIKKINSINKNMIFSIIETDKEIMFKFKYANSKEIIPLLKPRISGANISPYSTKNLPKKQYFIPKEELCKYDKIIAIIPKKDILTITHMTNKFIKSLTTKKYTMEDIKADMKFKCLKGKEYIYAIGKWEDYIKFLQDNIK